LQSGLDTFKENGAADRSGQATRALLFYEARLQAAEEQLANAQGAMSRYVATRPDLTRGGDGGFRQGLPLHAIDPQLGELQNRLEADQGAVARAREALEQARVVAAASLEGQKLGFQTLDPPQLPTRARRDLKTLAMFPAAGLLVGLGLSAALLVLLVALDRSVRSEAELARIGRVVGVVPYLQLEPGRPRRGPDPRHWWPRRARELITRTASPAPAGGR
jgi:hypothetical protein